MGTIQRCSKIISVFLSVLLFVTHTVLVHATEVNFWKERQSAQFVIPAFAGMTGLDIQKFGSFRKITSLKSQTLNSKQEKTILHIQDVHLNSEAQENISKAVGSLIENNQVDLIALEGAFVPIDLKNFHEFPDQNIVSDVADHLLKENKISGPIHAALKNKNVSIVGIDDQLHYNANVEAYRQASVLVKDQKNKLSELKDKLKSEKDRVFNAELKKFDAKTEAYRDGKISLGEYVQGFPKINSLPLSNINLFCEAYKMESSMNVNQIEAERARLITDLVKKLTQTEIDQLTQITLAYRASQVRHTDFYSYLKTLCEKKNVPLSRYKTMNAYIQYVLLTENIDSEKLFKELRTLEEEAFTALAVTAEEKQLVFESKRFFLMGKLLDFALTKEEWDEYRRGEPLARPNNVAPSFKGEPAVRASQRLAPTLEPFERFYDEAETRDRLMSAHLRQAIEKYHAKNIVLVTGGFHSSGIAQYIGRDTSLVSFTPKITKIDLPAAAGSASGTAYLSVFIQEKTPLDKLFEGQKLFLAQAPFSDGVSRLAATLTATRGFLANIKTSSFLERWLKIGTGWKKVHLSKLDDARVRIDTDIFSFTVAHWKISISPLTLTTAFASTILTQMILSAMHTNLTGQGLMAVYAGFLFLFGIMKNHFRENKFTIWIYKFAGIKGQLFLFPLNFHMSVDNQSSNINQDPSKISSTPDELITIETAGRLKVRFTLLKNNWEQLTSSAQEQIKNSGSWAQAPKVNEVEGRTIVIKFDKPQMVNGELLEGVEIKGSVWLNEGQPSVPEMTNYMGRGRPSEIRKVDPYGRMFFDASADRPTGAMLMSRAAQEFNMLIKMKGKQLPVDTPLGFGEFLDLKFKGEKTGFVLRGVKKIKPHRFKRSFLEDTAKHFDKWNKVDFSLSSVAIQDQIALDFFRSNLRKRFWKYGETLRLFHDRGFILGYPHGENFIIAGDEVLVKDFDNGEEKEGLRKDAAAIKQLIDLGVAWNSFHDLFPPDLLEELGEDPSLFFFKGYFGSQLDLEKAILNDNVLTELWNIPVSQNGNYFAKLMYSIVGDLEQPVLPEKIPAPLAPARLVTEFIKNKLKNINVKQSIPVVLSINPSAALSNQNISPPELLKIIELNNLQIYSLLGNLIVIHPDHPISRKLKSDWEERQPLENSGSLKDHSRLNVYAILLSLGAFLFSTASSSASGLRDLPELPKMILDRLHESPYFDTLRIWALGIVAILIFGGLLYENIEKTNRNKIGVLILGFVLFLYLPVLFPLFKPISWLFFQLPVLFIFGTIHTDTLERTKTDEPKAEEHVWYESTVTTPADLEKAFRGFKKLLYKLKLHGYLGIEKFQEKTKAEAAWDIHSELITKSIDARVDHVSVKVSMLNDVLYFQIQAVGSEISGASSNNLAGKFHRQKIMARDHGWEATVTEKTRELKISFSTPCPNHLTEEDLSDFRNLISETMNSGKSFSLYDLYETLPVSDGGNVFRIALQELTELQRPPHEKDIREISTDQRLRLNEAEQNALRLLFGIQPALGMIPFPFMVKWYQIVSDNKNTGPWYIPDPNLFVFLVGIFEDGIYRFLVQEPLSYLFALKFDPLLCLGIKALIVLVIAILFATYFHRALFIGRNPVPKESDEIENEATHRWRLFWLSLVLGLATLIPDSLVIGQSVLKLSHLTSSQLFWWTAIFTYLIIGILHGSFNLLARRFRWALGIMAQKPSTALSTGKRKVREMARGYWTLKINSHGDHYEVNAVHKWIKGKNRLMNYSKKVSELINGSFENAASHWKEYVQSRGNTYIENRFIPLHNEKHKQSVGYKARVKTHFVKDSAQSTYTYNSDGCTFVIDPSMIKLHPLLQALFLNHEANLTESMALYEDLQFFRWMKKNKRAELLEIMHQHMDILDQPYFKFLEKNCLRPEPIQRKMIARFMAQQFTRQLDHPTPETTEERIRLIKSEMREARQELVPEENHLLRGYEKLIEEIKNDRTADIEKILVQEGEVTFENAFEIYKPALDIFLHPIEQARTWDDHTTMYLKHENIHEFTTGKILLGDILGIHYLFIYLGKFKGTHAFLKCSEDSPPELTTWDSLVKLQWSNDRDEGWPVFQSAQQIDLKKLRVQKLPSLLVDPLDATISFSDPEQASHFLPWSDFMMHLDALASLGTNGGHHSPVKKQSSANPVSAVVSINSLLKNTTPKPNVSDIDPRYSQNLYMGKDVIAPNTANLIEQLSRMRLAKSVNIPVGNEIERESVRHSVENATRGWEVKPKINILITNSALVKGKILYARAIKTCLPAQTVLSNVVVMVNEEMEIDGSGINFELTGIILSIWRDSTRGFVALLEDVLKAGKAAARAA